MSSEIITAEMAAIGVNVADREYGAGKITFVSEDKKTIMVKFHRPCGVVPHLPKLYQWKAGYARYDVEEPRKEHYLTEAAAEAIVPVQGTLF